MAEHVNVFFGRPLMRAWAGLRPTRRAVRVVWPALVVLSAGLGGQAQAAGKVKLQQFSTRYYTLHTNLVRNVAQPIGRHMDAVFVAYQQRFKGFRARRKGRFTLYLFKSQKQYVDHLTDLGVDPGLTAGLFFARTGGPQGLATHLEGQSHRQMFQTLQHEGFHQFAYVYIGTNLPPWANEGLAEYFGDGILIDNKILLGQAGESRIATVRHLIRQGLTADFDTLLGMTGRGWFNTILQDPKKAAGLYQQSWSVVFFLIHAEKGRYRPAFEQYLAKLSNGMVSRPAFRKAFGSDETAPFQQRWEEYALAAKPDPLNTTLARMEFLGQGIRFLYERGERIPPSVNALRKRLQAVGFRVIRRHHGLESELSALDESVYKVVTASGRPGRFELRPPAGVKLPPTLTAIGVKPQPTLSWTRYKNGQLTDEIKFR